jgi:hypothetical protein
MLIDAGADVNSLSDGLNTPLHLSAYAGEVPAMCALLSHGADPSLRDDVGKTALDYALEQGHSDVMRLLSGSEKPDVTPKKRDSVDAMIEEAARQGWLPDRTLGLIPEIANIYKSAADHFLTVINESEPRMRETLAYHVCRYLFAKGVEGVILWGLAPDGKISIYFHEKHLVGDVETEVPAHLHKTVIDSMKIGESLFKAHQQFVIQAQQRGVGIDIKEEMKSTVTWVSQFGISYALFHKYQALR